MAELFLIRHAQASYGSSNYDKLSELGHSQSALLGEYFTQREISFDMHISGDMRRHKETMSGAVKYDHELIIDSAWNEFAFENVISAFLSLHPEKKPAENAARKEWYKLLKMAMLAWSEDQLGDGLPESWEAFTGRVNEASKRILNSGAKRTIVVSSGGAIAIFLKQLFNLDVEQAINFNLQIKNCSLHHFYFNKGGFQMSAFNHVPHLEAFEHRDKITYS